MNDIIWIFFVSLTTFGGSLLSGFAPLSIPMSDDKLQLMSAFGGGLLIGVDFICS